MLGQVPTNLVGLLDDWLYHKRIRCRIELEAETREHLKRWGGKEPFEDPTPALVVPILTAAIDEDREELKDLWARLLASAMHPDRERSCQGIIHRDIEAARSARCPLLESDR